MTSLADATKQQDSAPENHDGADLSSEDTGLPIILKASYRQMEPDETFNAEMSMLAGHELPVHQRPDLYNLCTASPYSLHQEVGAHLCPRHPQPLEPQNKFMCSHFDLVAKTNSLEEALSVKEHCRSRRPLARISSRYVKQGNSLGGFEVMANQLSQPGPLQTLPSVRGERSVSTRTYHVPMQPRACMTVSSLLVILSLPHAFELGEKPAFLSLPICTPTQTPMPRGERI